MDEVKSRKFASRKLAISLTALMFLLTASYCVCTAFASFAGDYTKRVEVNLNGTTEAGGAGLIKLEDTILLPNIFRNGTVSYSSRADTYLKSGSYYIPVQAMLTDSSYIKFFDAKITRGAYFSEDAYKSGRNVAVISESMAARLFTSLNAIGNEVELFNEKYTIVGLYREKDSLIALPGLDGADRVYVPFTSHAASGTLSIDTLYISDSYLKDEKFREHYVNKDLKSWLGLDTRMYKITDYYNATVMLTQFEDIFIFFIAIWCICILGGFVAVYISKNTEYIKSCIKEKYPGEFLKAKKLYVFGLLPGLMLLIASMVGIFLVTRPHIYIPAEFIPQENIFDLSFYAGRIKSAIIASNSAYGYVPTPLEKYYRSAQMINALILVCAVSVFFSVVSGLRLMKAIGGTGIELLKAVMLSCVSACVMSVLFSLIGGVELSIPLKNLAAILVFIFLKAAKAGIWKNTLAHAFSDRPKRGVDRIGI